MGFSTPYPPSTISVFLCWESTSQSPLVPLCLDRVLLCLHWHSFILFRTPDPPPPFRRSSASLDSPQFPLARLSIDLALFFLFLCSCMTFGALLYSTQHFPSGAPLFPGSWSPFSSECIILPFKPQYRFAASKHHITPLLDIPN